MRISRGTLGIAAGLAALAVLALAALRPWAGPKLARHLLPSDPEALQQALESLPSGVPRLVVEGQLRYELQPTGTLRTAAGVCREFDAAAIRSESRERGHGLACRERDGRWELRALEPLLQGPPQPGTVDPVTALGPGERLTLDQEQALLAQGWQVPAAPAR